MFCYLNDSEPLIYATYFEPFGFSRGENETVNKNGAWDLTLPGGCYRLVIEIISINVLITLKFFSFK